MKTKKMAILPPPLYDAQSMIKLLSYLEQEIVNIVLPIQDKKSQLFSLKTIIDDYCKIIKNYAWETIKAQKEHERG